MEFESIQEIFNKSFDMTEWKGVLKRLFSNFDEYRSTIDRLEPNLTYHEKAQEINEFGSILLADNKVIKLYDVLLKGDFDVAKSRVGLRNMIFRDIVPGDMDGILAVYRSENGKTWRLTFISKAIYWDDDFNEQKLQTSPRRYTYVLGEDESVKTAAKQFESLFNKKVTIKQLIEAFNVDKLNKRFFSDYQKHYEKFVLELTGEVWKKKQNKYVLTKIQEPSPLLKTAFYNNKKHARDFCKKLLGRIVFLHFLQKKGWMGCAIDDKHWENGEKQFMLELFNGFEDKTHFHSKCLTELFFNTLNKPNRNDIFEVERLSNHLNGSKVPYLNGGLFETDTNCDPFKVDFPPVFFEELLDFFGQYNFTIDENSPDDHEVGIDPEMLGHIFENLLEENKEKGAFYTPKEIVQYMTQESLIQYLQTHLGEHEELSNFIRNNDIGDRTAKHNYIRDNAAHIEELLDNVKICDPAIGSGAFPMGMLNEIFEAKMALDMTLNRSEVKKKIIQNSIYGVDLESGAVDIARLRFWLALVVDEDEPHALPNLDYKIMQGNSLLESFEGIDLSEIHKGKAITIDDENSGDNLFSKVMEVQEVYNEEKLEDLIKTYFDLDNPVEKKNQHNKIDKQILGKIYKCLFDEHEELEKELKKLHRKIKNKSASLSTAEQKIKYESTSKDAKNAKKLRDQIYSIAQKQLKLKELYESDDRPFFLWHLMFQDVLVDRKGFDIIIGNPPYGVSIKGDYRNQVLKEIGKVPDYEIYYYFIELAYKFSKENTILSYIIPNTYLFNTFAESYRNDLLDKWNLIEILDCTKFDIFENATVRNTINTWAKGSSNTVGYRKTKNINSFNELISYERHKISNYDLTSLNQNWGLAFYLNKQTINIVSRISKHKNSIENYYEISQGYIPYRRSDLIKNYGKEKGNSIVDNREWHSEQAINDDYIQEIFGRDINKFGKFQSSKKSFVKYGPHLAGYVDPKYFNQRRILVREITNPVIIAALIEEEYVNDPQLISIIPNQNNLISLETLWCILNSKLASFFHFNFSPKATKGAFPKILVRDIREFPIPDNLPDNLMKKMFRIIHQCDSKFRVDFNEIIEAIVLESYFKNEFKENNIRIIESTNELLEFELDDKSLGTDEIFEIHQKFIDKKNPLRNQIKLMKLELKQLLLPILSV